MSVPKVIAFYLPQYHPTAHNNEWWGKGFTEWTNVAKAKPLFKGHYQPHIPGELGFYDLRLPETRESQANLAKEYGVYGFCYYYYRFSKGHNELELPLNEVLRSGKPDFPFMICWANESWNKKFWRYDGTFAKETLAEQQYNGESDYADFFYEVLPLFKDKRYIKIDGKPAFMVYKPLELVDAEKFVEIWQSLAKKEGLEGIHFIGFTTGEVGLKKASGLKNKAKVFLRWEVRPTEVKNAILQLGFDSVTINRQNYIFAYRSSFARIIDFLHRKFFKLPQVVDYKDVVKYMIDKEDEEENVFPVAVPNWDHTPRSQYGGVVFQNSTPSIFSTYFSKVLAEVKNKEDSHQVVFLRAWNEWGEGNYVEPDLRFGRAYLESIKKCLEES